MSGRKNNLVSFTNIAAGDMATATVTSDVTNIQFLDNIGLQLNWTGSPVGSFAIQISADYAQDNSSPPNVTTTGHWIPLVLSYWDGSAFVTSASIPTSLGSPIYLDLALISAPWIRIVYTKSSGSGTLTGTITAKTV